MSLKSWKEKYYPVDASKVKESDAITHSLVKWVGLREVNLKRHQVVAEAKRIVEYNSCGSVVDSFAITSDTCSLCVVYNDDVINNCEKCPLAEFLGNRCDIAKYLGSKDSPYAAFTLYGDPEPMINALSHIALGRLIRMAAKNYKEAAQKDAIEKAKKSKKEIQDCAQDRKQVQQEQQENENKELGEKIAALESERKDTVYILRMLCADYGDNKWEDDLHLADIIEKHLRRHLDTRSWIDRRIEQKIRSLAKEIIYTDQE